MGMSSSDMSSCSVTTYHHHLTNACHWSHCQDWARNAVGVHLWRSQRGHGHLHCDFPFKFQYQMMGSLTFQEISLVLLFWWWPELVFTNTNISGPDTWYECCWRSKVVLHETAHRDWKCYLGFCMAACWEMTIALAQGSTCGLCHEKPLRYLLKLIF